MQLLETGARSMEIFAWKPEFSVSVSVLDAQHKRLFALAQNLQDAMRAGRDRDVLANCLGNLVAYTNIHFAEEESMMERHNYPELRHHQMQHALLLKKISEFQNMYNSGNAVIMLELTNFIQDWITTHIMQTDYSYGNFFNKLGVY
jgi:hemerythrin